MPFQAVATPVIHITTDHLSYWYDKAARPAATATPGEIVQFDTLDARSGSVFDHPIDSTFELAPPVMETADPLTGPLRVSGVEPGDAIVLDIVSIDTTGPGWTGAHATANMFSPGRVPRAVGRVCAVDAHTVRYSQSIDIPSHPMVGCIGTAPAAERVHARFAGRHGGNMDQTIVRAGARLYLPASVSGGLVFVGDVHAVQGEGELSGVGLEIAARVTMIVDIRRGLNLRWPWIETSDRIAVMTAAMDFSEARREAVDSAMRALEIGCGLQPADALALISVSGDLRIGQACGLQLPLTLRVELPRFPGLTPV